MMPSYGVRKNLRDQSIVRHRGELHGQLRARRRMVHLQRGAFETALKGRRIFAKIVNETRERGRVLRAEFCRALARPLCDGTQVFGQRLPTLLISPLKRVRKKRALSFRQSSMPRLASPTVSIAGCVQSQKQRRSPSEEGATTPTAG